jgi:AraC-like DNA-binding protein/quercetin dioxygenase-like cupin family protein
VSRPQQRTAAKREWVRLHVEPRLRGLEAIHAQFADHRFARHSHAEFVIGVVERGRQSFRYRGQRCDTPPGWMFVIPPGEAHTGESPDSGGYVYRTIYPSVALLAQLELEGVGRNLLAVASPVIDDPATVALFMAVHRAMFASAPLLATERSLRHMLVTLAARHGAGRTPAAHVGRARAAVRTAREYVDAHFADDVSLATLAALVGLSPYYLARAFEREVGIPPHAYLEGKRVDHARILLATGTPTARVAFAVGYADQAHFSRRFKRFTGLTPARYARDRKIRQERTGDSA